MKHEKKINSFIFEMYGIRKQHDLYRIFIDFFREKTDNNLLIDDRLIQMGNSLTIDDVVCIRNNRIFSEESIHSNTLNVKKAIRNINNDDITEVYMMKIYLNNAFTNIVKIGYSNDIYARAKSLTKSIKKKVNIQYSVIPYMKLKDKRNKIDALNIEKTLHLLLWKKKYEAINTFDGSTELFKYETWFDNLFDETLDNNIL